jgi:NAD(P)-dependent dehydrogenase (short-subunit alcohol dehydrogenase family)
MPPYFHTSKKFGLILTGAAQGIEMRIASRLAREDAQVTVCDINGEKAEQKAEEPSREGLKVIAVQANVSKIADIRRITRYIADQFGSLDIFGSIMQVFLILLQ